MPCVRPYRDPTVHRRAPLAPPTATISMCMRVAVVARSAVLWYNTVIPNLSLSQCKIPLLAYLFGIFLSPYILTGPLLILLSLFVPRYLPFLASFPRVIVPIVPVSHSLFVTASQGWKSTTSLSQLGSRPREHPAPFYFYFSSAGHNPLAVNVQLLSCLLALLLPHAELLLLVSRWRLFQTLFLCACCLPARVSVWSCYYV